MNSFGSAMIPFALRACASITLLLIFVITANSAAGMQTVEGHIPKVIAKLGLRPTGSLAPTQQMHVVMVLPLRNRDQLTNMLQQLYDPANPNFHHFLKPGQFTEKFGPTPEDYATVSNFAVANGLTIAETSPGRTLLGVRGSVADIERTFHVGFNVYKHPTEPRTFFAPDREPSLDLAVPVQHIAGFNSYGQIKPASLKSNGPSGTNGPKPMIGSGPGGAFVGNDFRAAYAPGADFLTGAGQSVGLAEFDGFFPQDITSYEQLAGLPNVPLQVVPVAQFNEVPFGIPGFIEEVSLDIEMAIAMAPGLSSVIVYEAGGVSQNVNESEDMVLLVLNQMATDDQASQLSISWLYKDGDYDLDGTSLDDDYMQYASQGQSFFQASGDTDAYVPNAPPFPGDPAPYIGDQYVTMVGGTMLTTTGPGGAWSSEAVWNAGDLDGDGEQSGNGSCGGTSTIFAIPPYQAGVNMSANGGSTTMRNFPDVAMVASNVLDIANQGATNFDQSGTSIAAPLWAGFMALVNQQAVSIGEPPVGFINPAIYAIGLGPNYTSDFHDITTGNNAWTSSFGGSSGLFPAVTGYDLCTGWGSPSGLGLINALTGEGQGVVWVDFNVADFGYATGTFDLPFPLLSEGLNDVPSGGTLVIKVGSTTNTLTISKPMTIRCFNGPATIGSYQ